METIKVRDVWQIAQAIVGVLEYDLDGSIRAGYNIFRAEHGYICDLGDRLEVNLQNGKTLNLWRVKA